MLPVVVIEPRDDASLGRIERDVALGGDVRAAGDLNYANAGCTGYRLGDGGAGYDDELAMGIGLALVAPEEPREKRGAVLGDAEAGDELRWAFGSRAPRIGLRRTHEFGASLSSALPGRRRAIQVRSKARTAVRWSRPTESLVCGSRADGRPIS